MQKHGSGEMWENGCRDRMCRKDICSMIGRNICNTIFDSFKKKKQKKKMGLEKKVYIEEVEGLGLKNNKKFLEQKKKE